MRQKNEKLSKVNSLSVFHAKNFTLSCRAHLANFAFCSIPMNFSNLYLQTILLETICPAVVSKPEILIIMLHTSLYTVVVVHRTLQTACHCFSIWPILETLGLSSFYVAKYLLHKNALQYLSSCNPLDVQCNCTRIITFLVPLVC